MIRVEEADSLIRSQLPSFPVSAVPLEEAHGRILKEDIFTDRDLPPYDRVTMDGIAIDHTAIRNGQGEFRIECVISAGDEPPELSDTVSACIQVMTGAKLPGNCDSVIPVENLSIENNIARLKPEIEVKPRQHIHPKGSDRMIGDSVLQAGLTLNSIHICIAAAVGRSRLNVADRPRFAVLTTGNEIVPVDSDVGPFQIRSSNDHGIRAALIRTGYPAPGCVHVQDDAGSTKETLKELLDTFSGIIITGGVSMGEHDHIPDALESLNVSRVFHKIRQRPGKPLWFGISGNGKPVFALPGNPVSTMVCLHRFVIPHMEEAIGAQPKPMTYAVMEEEVVFTANLTYHVPVKTKSRPDGRLSAWPVITNTSGDFSSLQGSDGFVELPRTGKSAPKGTTAAYFRWI